MKADREFCCFTSARLLTILFAFLFEIVTLTGCGGSGGEDASSSVSISSAPTISGLSYSPESTYTVPVGEVVTISGTFDFTDPDGDLDSVTLIVLNSSNQTIISENFAIDGVAGMKSGTLEGSVTAGITIAGSYTIQIYVTDDKGHRSNQLQGVLRVVAFPWVFKTPMPTPRSDFASAGVGGLIYIIGGSDIMAPIIPNPPVSLVEIYDPHTDTWQTGPAMPVARSGQMAAVVNGKIYVFGGNDEFQLQTNTVLLYDPGTNMWTVKPGMPDERANGAIAVENDLVYIAGGYSTGWGLSSLLIYDPAIDSFNYGAPMMDSRIGPRGAAIGNQILVYGGYGNLVAADGGYLGTMESYDPSSNVWSTMTPGTPSRDFGIAVLNELLYAFGGNNVSRSLHTVSAYDIDSNTWMAKTSMSVSMGFAQAETINDKIYVFDANNLLEYTPSNDLM